MLPCTSDAFWLRNATACYNYALFRRSRFRHPSNKSRTPIECSPHSRDSLLSCGGGGGDAADDDVDDTDDDDGDNDDDDDDVSTASGRTRSVTR